MANGKTKAGDARALKAKYLKCFGSRTSIAATLREAVGGLIRLGISRRALLSQPYY